MRASIHSPWKQNGPLNNMKRILVGLASVWLLTGATFAREQWTPQQANEWYAKQPWLVGCNFAPSTAINQLEMWQAESWDPQTIDRELGWAEDLGFTSVRVFLHHLVWQRDKAAYLKRIEEFLTSAAKHRIGVMFVHFDAVWDPF